MSVNPAHDTGGNGLIYILQDGQQPAYEEAQVRDMLTRQILTPETYFWKEGMAEWRPLSELPPRSGSAIVPPRRTGNPTSGPEVLTRHFQPAPKSVVPQDSDTSRFQGRRSSGRYHFETNPVPLTVIIQILMVASIGVTIFFICKCLGKILGWSSLSHADIPYFNNFVIALNCIHLGIEILFFFWIYYSNKNCNGFTNNMTYTPGWSVGYFFIPVLNLFRPYQVMQEIWKVSRNPRSWIGHRDSIFVGVWFFFRLVLFILCRGRFHTSYADSTVPAVQAIGRLINLATFNANFVLIELTSLILISVVTWRQVKWVRQSND